MTLLEKEGREWSYCFRQYKLQAFLLQIVPDHILEIVP